MQNRVLYAFAHPKQDKIKLFWFTNSPRAKQADSSKMRHANIDFSRILKKHNNWTLRVESYLSFEKKKCRVFWFFFLPFDRKIVNKFNSSVLFIIHFCLTRCQRCCNKSQAHRDTASLFTRFIEWCAIDQPLNAMPVISGAHINFMWITRLFSVEKW